MSILLARSWSNSLVAVVIGIWARMPQPVSVTAQDVNGVGVSWSAGTLSLILSPPERPEEAILRAFPVTRKARDARANAARLSARVTRLTRLRNGCIYA